MRRSKVLLGFAVAVAVTAIAACGRDPRVLLGALQIPYTANAFVTQAAEGDVKAVTLLLDAGMPADSRDDRGSTALIAAAVGRHRPVVEALLEADADVNVTNNDGVTALSSAAWNGDLDSARALLDKGADVRVERPVATLPLMRAIRGGHDDMVALLLEKGAIAYVQDDQWSALMLSAFLGREESVTKLISYGVDVNAKNDRGMTSLMHGASRGHVAIINTLLAKGAHVGAVDAGGHTALMYAANNGHLEAARALLDAKADAGVRNRTGATALSLAAGNGHADLVTLLGTPTIRSDVPAPVTQEAGVISDEQLGKLARASLVFPEERRVHADAAATAWAYVDRHYRPSTGLIEPTSGYRYATVWDIASGLSALYAAHELKLLSTADYDRRISKALDTLKTAALFDEGGFNKLYSTTTGQMAGTDGRPTSRGFGWSALDIGRLLVWLKIVAEHQPQYRDAATAIVKRLALDRIVTGGYLYGEDLDQAGAVRRYQEGRIGYEQYAARGFALWGASPVRALRLHENSIPITVMDLPLPGDIRGGDRLTSDPLVLMGLELGWDMETEQVALQFLRVQEARHRKTGLVTLTGEDAVDIAPHFFYYYCAYTTGKAFGVDVQDRSAVVDGPRWVSAKAAFAWHVLRPSAYTELTVHTVSRARGSVGWGSGVYEGSHEPTGAPNINTAAVILTAALVHARGGPVLSDQSR